MAQYPRVTEILKPFSNYDQIPKDILEKAAGRGNKVHGICAGLARGAWIPDSMIDEELKGYIDSFKQWSEKQVDKFNIVEKRYFHDALQYTGQVDMVVSCKDGNRYLVDLKTTAAPQKTHPVQMGAYSLLLRNNGEDIYGAMVVYLSKKGEFPDIHLLEDIEIEQQVFMNALYCWKYFNKGDLNGDATAIAA